MFAFSFILMYLSISYASFRAITDDLNEFLPPLRMLYGLLLVHTDLNAGLTSFCMFTTRFLVANIFISPFIYNCNLWWCICYVFLLNLVNLGLILIYNRLHALHF